ncbi:hypothetical protein AA0614_2126 [Komagataeibacter saccharivorans NRIC 0614]|nr:hypothetical protein AA0614_2126 [Komagataeibacter saccharivorans NRIC 0614]
MDAAMAVALRSLAYRVGGVLDQLEELAIGVAARQHLDLGFVVFIRVSWLSAIRPEPTIALICDKSLQRTEIVVITVRRCDRCCHHYAPLAQLRV